MSLRVYIAGLLFAVAGFSASTAEAAYVSSLFTTGTQSQTALYQLNLATRGATLVGLSSPTPGSGLIGGTPSFNIDGLSLGPDGTLYAVAEDLYLFLRIDPATGAATVVGPLNLAGPGVATTPRFDFSMALTGDGRAWLASGGAGNLWQVDTATGATSLVGSFIPPVPGGTVTITGLAARGNILYATGSQSDRNLYTVDTTSAALTLVGPYGGNAGAVHQVSPAFDANGLLWAILNNNTYPSSLALIDPASGAMTVLGTITGTQKTAAGISALAIVPANEVVNAPAGVAPTTPMLPPSGLMLLACLFIVAAYPASKRICGQRR
jgi:hypothetical protein